jgi:hypothetical protein
MFLSDASKDSVFGDGNSVGGAACFMQNATASGTLAEWFLIVGIPRNGGNRCAILNSGFGFGINRKRFILVR